MTSMVLEKSWNETILEHCVLPCFIRFIERRVEEMSSQHHGEEASTLAIIRKYYNYFPDINEGDGSLWKELSGKFYTNVSEKNLKILFVNKSGSLIPCAPQNDFLLYNPLDDSTKSTISTQDYNRIPATTNYPSPSSLSNLSSCLKFLSLVKQLFIHVCLLYTSPSPRDRG